MIGLAGLFLMAAPAPVVGDDLAGANRLQIQSALTRAKVAINEIGQCDQIRPGEYEDRYEGRMGRLLDAMVAAEELYEIDAMGESLVLEAGKGTPPCSEASLQLSMAEADRALAEAAALIGVDAAPRGVGLWFGALRLCGERVTSIEAAPPDAPGEGPRLAVHFSEAFEPQIEAYSRTRVGKQVFILLNGGTLSARILREPLSDGLSVDMPEGYSVEIFRRAVSSGC